MSEPPVTAPGFLTTHVTVKVATFGASLKPVWNRNWPSFGV